MKHTVFLSWSGEDARRLAQTLHRWIPMILQNVTPWMSAIDLEVGSRWNEQLANRLDLCSFGILCLSPQNVVAPWILFEAGALAKRFRSKTLVCPYLLEVDFNDLPDSLGQFQGAKANKSGTFSLLRSLNDALGEDRLSLGVFSETFDRWWPDVEAELESVRSTVKERKDASFVVIDSLLERTNRIVGDLNALAGFDSSPPRKRVVRYSGFLSALAITDDDQSIEGKAPLRQALRQERDAIIGLVRKGCIVRSIITPPSRNDCITDHLPRALARVEGLLDFMQSRSAEDRSSRPHSGASIAGFSPGRFEWAISPFRQKNTYIIDNIACYEGFKRGGEPGYELTLRQTAREAIEVNIDLYDRLFDYLRDAMLMPAEETGTTREEYLDEKVIRCLHDSRNDLRQLRTRRSTRRQHSENGRSRNQARKNPSA